MTHSQSTALYERFLRGLAAHPRRDAARAGGRSISYEAAHELALRWAGALRPRLVGPAPAVGVLADKGIDAYVGLLAALYTGAAVVPLHPAFPAARTRAMLLAAGVSAVFADAAGAKALAATGVDTPVLALDSDGGGPGAGWGAALAEPVPVNAADAAYILFTSGSTGTPKGVPISHANTDHYFRLMDERYRFTAEDVFSQTFDLNFDCAMFDLFCAWGAGAAVQAVPAGAYRAMPEFVAQHGLTVWFSTPSSIALLRRTGGLAPGALPSLRWSLFAGEALQAADAATWQAAADRSTLENIYGPTELTVTVSGHRWSPHGSPALCVNGLVPIGSVHPGHAYLLLGEDGEEAHTEGELCITGAQMTAGYLDPADNEGRFLVRAGRRWYRTGDRVRLLPNGELVYFGRVDAQVQVQGWRVELAELDHALRGCAGVEDAATVARAGAKGTELVAFYTGVPAAPAELVRRLRETLPEGMLPREFRHLDRLPLNPNRKVDRSRLARVAAGEGADLGVRGPA